LQATVLVGIVAISVFKPWGPRPALRQWPRAVPLGVAALIEPKLRAINCRFLGTTRLYFVYAMEIVMNPTNKPSRGVHRAAVGIGIFVTLALSMGPAIADRSDRAYRLIIFDRDAGSFTPTDVNASDHVAGVSRRDDGDHVVVLKGDTFDDLGSGVPLAINDKGQLAGRRGDPSAGVSATLWERDGTVVSFGAAGLIGEAMDINNRGELVGRATANFVSYATRWSVRKGAVYLSVGGANSINNRGDIAGYYQASEADVNRAAVWEGDTLTVLGGPLSVATAINNAGQVAGVESNSAVLWQSGRRIDLGALTGQSGSEALGINQRGDVVGSSGSPFPLTHAALWRRTDVGYEAIDINSLIRPGPRDAGWVLMIAFRINDRGTIVGRTFNQRLCDVGVCENYGFLLTRSHHYLPDQYPDPRVRR
jgi:uncharacterized membrane protein